MKSHMGRHCGNALWKETKLTCLGLGAPEGRNWIRTSYLAIVEGELGPRLIGIPHPNPEPARWEEEAGEPHPEVACPEPPGSEAL